MGYCIGLDIGTSTICAALIDTQSGKLVCSANERNDAAVIYNSKNKSGWAEQSPDRIVSIVFTVLCKLKDTCRVDLNEVGAVGITNQMHGMLLIDKDKNPVSNLITWEDRRCLSIISF